MDIKQADRQYIAHTYARQDVLFVRGENATLYDETGKAYIDLGGGIAVNTFGVGDSAWLESVTHQLGQLQHISNLYYTEPQVRLAQLLCEKTGMKKVFFANSGAEANECAIKTARKYASDQGKARGTVITLENSFHGRTLTTLAATGQPGYHQHFDPFPQGFVHVPANDLAALEMALQNNACCAVMLELVQGEGGLCVLEKAYVQAAEKLARAHDCLLLIDEVQTGNGRCGTLYCYEQYGITPDIVSTAKGLGGGLPFGATLLGARVENTLTAGTHGSTFGGNPVCCAGAYSILRRLDADFLAQVQKKGDYIRAQLTGAPGVVSLHGLGLMLGISTTAPAAQIAQDCLKEGLVVLTAKEKVRLLPPLSISEAELQSGISILKQVLAAGT